MKPKVFVGSSREALDIANAVHENLSHDAEVTVWNQGIFNLSEPAVDSLLEQLNRMDFGVFVFAPDDVVNIRGEQNRATRDNVVLELGLYIGHLGRQRSFVFLPRDQDDLRLPTDIVGLTTATYESDRSDNNYMSWTAVACNQARRRMSQLGSRTEPDTPASSVQQEDQRSAEMRALDSEEVRDRDAQDEQTDESWEQAYKDNDYDKAIELLQESIETADEEDDKQFLGLWVGRVKASNDFSMGIKYLRERIDERPDDFRGYFFLSWTYEDNDLYDDSITVLNEGLESATIKRPLSWLKATNLARSGDINEAKALLNKVIEDDPEGELAYTGLARILIDEDERHKARKVYESGLKTLPNSEDLLSGYATLLMDIEEHEAALVTYRKLLSLRPKNTEYLGLLGNAYLMLDLYGLALEAYENASEIAEENEEGWIVSNIGNLYNSRGFHSKAAGFLKKALQMDPDSAYAAERLADAIKEDREERRKANKIMQEQRRAARSKPAS